MTSNLDAIFDQLDEAMEASTVDAPLHEFSGPGDRVSFVIKDISTGQSDFGPYTRLIGTKADGEWVRVHAIGTVFDREVEDQLARGMTLGWACVIQQMPDRTGKNGPYKVFKVKAMPTGEAPAPAPATNGDTEAPAATQEPLDDDRPF